MKVKALSKVLALMVAAVMIFTAVPLMAFAETETAELYTVSYGAPAIPMEEMSIVDLTDLEVEMDKDGTTANGADITWAAAAQDGLEFDATAKTIFAKKAGTYKLTATANGVTKNVWVIVRTAAQDKFYLVNIPELNKDTFVAKDWRLIGGRNKLNVALEDAIDNGVTLNADYVQVKSLIDNQKDATLVYFNEIFNDFADYTVESSVSSSAASDSTGAGVGGRITLNETQKGYTTGIVSLIRYSKQVAITRLNASTKLPDDFGPHGTKEPGAWNSINTYHEVKSVFDGNNLKFYYDYDEGVKPLYDHTSEPGKCTCGNSKCIFYTEMPGAGYPALVTYNADTNFKSFAVYLNSDKLAPATVLNFYTVSNGAPAIPMTENTGVDLNYVNVEMDAEGTVAFASDIVWDTAETEGIYLNKEANKVSVYEAGNYKLTATANGVTKNVWIVAKKATDDKYYIVNIPELNKDTFVANDWRIFGSANNTNYTIDSAISNGYLTLADNYVETAQAFGSTTALRKGGTLVYVNKIFNDFGDYTVEGYMSSAAAVDGVGAGVGARVHLNDTEDGYTTAILSYVRQTRAVAITRLGNDYGPHGETIDTSTGFTVWKNIDAYHTVKNVYDGTNTTYYYGSEAIYTHTSPAGTCTCGNSGSNPKCIYKNNPPTTGYPALVGFGATAHFSSFSVYLNSTNAPDAIEADEKPVPPAPEADITIVGEGTAEVEAVVGSDNTYNVEIAPADGYKVKVGSLYINGKAVIDSDATGRVYTFTTEDLDNTTIAVTYIEDNGQFNTAMLGAQVNPTKSGIRFGARTDSIKRAAEDANAGLLDNRIFVDGVTYGIEEIGMIMVPTKLLNGAELEVGGNYVVRQAVSKVVSVTDDFADIAITLTGIPKTQYGVKISSRMYIAYEDADGVMQYIYTEVIERSYNDVLDAMAQ